MDGQVSSGNGILTPTVFFGVVGAALAMCAVAMWFSSSALAPAVACFFGVTHLVKSRYTKVARTALLAGVSMVVATATAVLASPLLWQLLVWSCIAGLLYATAGAWVLTAYLRLPREVNSGADVD